MNCYISLNLFFTLFIDLFFENSIARFNNFEWKNDSEMIKNKWVPHTPVV